MGLVFDLWSLLEAGHQGECRGLDGQAPRRCPQYAGAEAEAEPSGEEVTYLGRGAHWLWPVVYHVRVIPSGPMVEQGAPTHYVRLGHNGQQCQVLEERVIP